jgi:hypothetical protein
MLFDQPWPLAKVMEGSGTVHKIQWDLRCHIITLLQDCDISGAGIDRVRTPRPK